MIGIYLIRHKETGMCYVGQSVDIDRRFKNHHYTSKYNYIDKAIRKYGVDAFVFEILELCEENNLDQREIHWIAACNSIAPNGYNFTHGGSSGRPSKETLKKLSESHKGIRHSPATRKKLSESHKGKTLSAETRKKISAAHKGKTLSIEQRKQLSELNKGKKISPETRKKIGDAHRGKKTPPKTRQKMSIAQKGKKHSLESRIKMSDAKKGKTAWNKGKRMTKKSSPLQLKLF